MSLGNNLFSARKKRGGRRKAGGEQTDDLEMGAG
jgi:hypothetical protein